jgi:hypothetical protein
MTSGTPPTSMATSVNDDSFRSFAQLPGKLLAVSRPRCDGPGDPRPLTGEIQPRRPFGWLGWF